MNETLVILQEECAEVIQAISKIHRFGMNDSYNGITNLEHLVKELGDLNCMINMFIDQNKIDRDIVQEYEQQKKAKLKTWSNLVPNE